MSGRANRNPMFVQCPLADRCPSVGKAHRPNSKRFKEHQRLAERSATSGNVGPDAEVTPPRASAPTTASKFDDALDFADRHDVTVSAAGDLHRGDNQAYLNTSFYRQHGGLNMDDEEDYTAEVIVRARDMANTTTEDLADMSKDMTNKACGERATDAIERADSMVRQANEMAALLGDYDGEYPGAKTVGEIKEIGLGRWEMDARDRHASDLVKQHGISVESTNWRDSVDGYGPDIGLEAGYSQHFGEVVLVAQNGQKATVNYMQFSQVGQEPGEVKPEDVVRSAVMDMSLVESSYQSVTKANSPDGRAPDFPGFSTGTADYVGRDSYGVDVAGARSYMYNTVAALDETRYAARNFFGLNG